MHRFSTCRQWNVLCHAHKFCAISPFLGLVIPRPPFIPTWLVSGAGAAAGRHQHPGDHVGGGFFLLTLGSAWHRFCTCCTPCSFFIESPVQFASEWAIYVYIWAIYRYIYMCLMCWMLELLWLSSSWLHFCSAVTAQSNLLLLLLVAEIWMRWTTR